MNPIYHIDANNSGAWKRVLRDVKAAALPEVLRAIAIGQRGAACGASATPTGCASNGSEKEE